MNYTNPTTNQINLTPQHRNFATEGGLDTSIINGKSVQRTLNLLTVQDCEGDLKVVGKVKDGETFNNVVHSNVKSWIVLDLGDGYRTAWLYTVTAVNYAVQQQGLAPSKKLVFANMSDLYDFYEAVFLKTAEEQPVGNVGYSVGSGTILKDLGVTIDMCLESGLRVVTWRMVEQITSQNDVAIGGNSPDGTIGFVTIYSDWNNNGKQDGINPLPSSLGYEYGDFVGVGPLELF